MNKIKQHIYKAMFWLLPWLCAVPLASCSFDDDIVESCEGPATMQLSITAREEGDLNTRVNDYEIGQDHEYMHNLLVLFIQDGKVVKKFSPDLRYNEAAQEGNLRVWTSEEFTLDPGTYTVYAFANIDTYYDGLWGSLTGLGDGESLTEKGINIDNIVLEDNPASKLDFSNYFIPMSAKEKVTVTSSTRNISIGLDRLVSKIRMSITGNPGTKITALSFGGYADKIGLFSDTQVDGINYDREYSVVEEGESPVPLNDDGTYQFADFYVNSSPANSGYKVTLNTDEKNGTTYTATTTRKVLPRNSIFPIVLNLTGYEVSLDLHCWVSPIGNVPVEVEVELSPDPDYYTCTIPEGCQFEFTVGVTPVSSSGTPAVTDLKGAWTFDETKITGLVFDDYTEGETTVKGHVTASARETFNLTFDVTWTPEGGNPTKRGYNVEITTGDIADFPFKRSQSNTRASEFTLDYLGPEMLNMFIK